MAARILAEQGVRLVVSYHSSRREALETVVMLELDRRGAEVAYVHTPAGFEVDFLARHPAGGEELIQVCASLDNPATLEREVRALRDGALAYPRATLRLIGLDLPARLAVPAGIVVSSALDWLLENPS